jgi:hypothetical protein
VPARERPAPEAPASPRRDIDPGLLARRFALALRATLTGLLERLISLRRRAVLPRFGAIDRRVRLVGAVVLAGVLLVLLVGALLARSGDDRPGASPVVGPVREVEGAPVIDFPAPSGVGQVAEDRVRPAGVRALALGFEAPVIAVGEVVGCAALDPESDRANWFDLPVAAAEDADGVTAVAPGEDGVAVILGSADPAVPTAPLSGIGGASVGTVIEIARANGTVLTWRTVGVVTASAGAPFPVAALVPAEEQRLLLVGCGEVVDGAPQDVYVLARRGS